MIPFSPPYIDEDVINEVLDSLRSGWITTGPKVKALEKEVAGITGIENVLCVNSATSAMMLMLHWYGIGKGDEVIIPAYTYVATALAAIHLGAKAVMIDVNDDFCIDTSKIKKAITPRTKAIVPVDIGGCPCDYDEIYKIVNDDEVRKLFIPANDVQRKLGRIFIMADSAHSIGALYKGKQSGSLCDSTIFSFHAVKNVTTAEGGAICLNLPDKFDNAELYNWLRLLSLNGQTKDAFTKSQGGNWKYDIIYSGFKINLSDICAAIGLAQIRKYDNELLIKRKRIFEMYNAGFSRFEWIQIPPSMTSEKESSYHVYLLRIKGVTEDQRDEIIEEINKREVAVNVHFVPLPLLSIFKSDYDIKDFSTSYDNYSREISLPVYPQLKDSEIKEIIESVTGSYETVIKNN